MTFAAKSPGHLAAARATVCDPEAFLHSRALQQAAFLSLKEAQGHPVTQERFVRLFGPLHLVSTSPRRAPEPSLEACRMGALARTRAAITRRGDTCPTSGGAA